MNMKIALAVAVAASLAGSAQAAAPLTDVSFDDGLNGWNVVKSLFSPATASAVGSTTVNGVAVNPVFGQSMAELTAPATSIPGSVTLFETATAPLGAGYTLWYRLVSADHGGSFLVNSVGDGLSIQYATNGQTAAANWQALVPALGSKNYDSGDTGWLSFVLPQNTTALKFTFASDGDKRPSYAFLDVTPVPEPGEWAMILAGLGMIGMMARRRSFNV